MSPAVLAGILGLFIGSFLNVCIVRMPRDESVVAPRSHCRHCKKSIQWFDNIPLISFVFLVGRCRHCRAPIHWRYPAVELVTGLGMAWMIARFGAGPVGWIWAAAFCALLTASLIDLEHQILPDEITLGGLVVGLVASAFVPSLHDQYIWWQGLWQSAVGAITGAASIYLTAVLGEMAFKRESMGPGDIKLMAMIGSLVGWKLVLLVFFMAPFFGLGVGLVARIKFKADVIPYGPHLSLAAMVAALWGEKILRWWIP